MEIRGKTALVTGGASGLGAAAVRRIVAAGGNAVILDVQEEKGKTLASQLRQNRTQINADGRRFKKEKGLEPRCYEG